MRADRNITGSASLIYCEHARLTERNDGVFYLNGDQNMQRQEWVGVS